MIGFNRDATKFVIYLATAACILAGDAIAQNSTAAPVQHLSFDSPEAWALKYFTSATMLSGLQPPETLGEQRQTGSITLGLEMGWLPSLDAERARVGFSGKKQEDVSKAPAL